MQGQTTVLLLILFSLTYVSLKQSQDLRAGFFLGLGLFKFPVVFPFAIICLLRRKWKMLAGCAFGRRVNSYGGADRRTFLLPSVT